MLSRLKQDRRSPLRVWALVLMALALTGCDVDSYINPSVVGRWESTPVVLPILDRLDVIEEPEESIPGLSQITSEDLVPEISEYVMGPGDFITLTVFELVTPGLESVQNRRIDELGQIRVPVIGQIRAAGLTAKQLEQRIINILHPNVLRDPSVSVIVQEGRSNTFSVIGAASAVGTYALLRSDFRLIDAIALARGIPPGVDTIYVIRQVPLVDSVEGRVFGPEVEPGEYAPPLRPTDDQGTGGTSGGAVDTGSLLEGLLEGIEPATGVEPDAAIEPDPTPMPAGDMGGDLGGALDPGPVAAPVVEDGRWVNVDGQWVQVAEEAPTTGGSGLEGSLNGGLEVLPAPEQMVTQRVIEIDAHELQRGIARYNIVIRPGDIIRVPDPVQGNIYLGGFVARPGTYALPGERQLTLTQAIISAGGLDQTAIPERVDLTRRLGPNSEATVQLNLRAIFEGVQPNIYLKPNDTVNVGTNLIAPFLAVTRNGFRMSYGFGFLLDRNFAENVFGPLQNR